MHVKNLNPGDAVEVYRINRWGGHVPLDYWGLLIKRTYITLDPNYNKWDVLVNGTIMNINETCLKVKF